MKKHRRTTAIVAAIAIVTIASIATLFVMQRSKDFPELDISSSALIGYSSMSNDANDVRAPIETLFAIDSTGKYEAKWRHRIYQPFFGHKRSQIVHFGNNKIGLIRHGKISVINDPHHAHNGKDLGSTFTGYTTLIESYSGSAAGIGDATPPGINGKNETVSNFTVVTDKSITHIPTGSFLPRAICDDGETVLIEPDTKQLKFVDAAGVSSQLFEVENASDSFLPRNCVTNNLGEKTIIASDNRQIVYLVKTGDKLSELARYDLPDQYSQVAYVDDSLVLLYDKESGKLTSYHYLTNNFVTEYKIDPTELRSMVSTPGMQLVRTKKEVILLDLKHNSCEPLVVQIEQLGEEGDTIQALSPAVWNKQPFCIAGNT